MVDAHLLGTQHNTEKSINRVEQEIRDREPDVVAVELPPHVFEDDPEWSLRAALDPREPVTLPGLLMYRRLDGDIWPVDEMFVGARVAADVGADVALIDRPFAESLDEFTLGMAADATGWLQLLGEEAVKHRELLSTDVGAAVDRDVWKVGDWAAPWVDYVSLLQRHGARNPLDSSQRAAARDRAGADGAKAYLNGMAAVLPRLMQTHIDERDAHMAGHLRWLARERDDVLGIVAEGHVRGVVERVDGTRQLDVNRVSEPPYADPASIPETPPQVDQQQSE